jgi:hypothetical protein
MMNFKRAIVYTCTLATMLGAAGLTEAKIPPKSKRDFNYSFETLSRNNKVRLREQINRNFRGQNKLKVRQILGMNASYRGMTLKKVIIVGSTAAGRGKATLMINGYEVDQTQVPTYEQRNVLLPNPNENIIGEEVRTVQIKLKGNFHVSKLIAVLEDNGFDNGHSPRVQILSQPVQQNFRNQSKLAVRNLLNMGQQFRGDKLTKVILKAESAHGRGQAKLLINGSQVGRSQTIGKWLDTIEFSVPSYMQEIGYDINTVKIELQGNIYVESLNARIMKSATDDYDNGNDWGYDPIDGGQLSSRPYQTVYAQSSLSLAELLNASYRDGAKRVETVTIEARASVRGQIQLCTVGRFQTCTETKIVRGSTRAQFHLRGMHKLQDIRVKTQGNMTITSIKAML